MPVSGRELPWELGDGGSDAGIIRRRQKKGRGEIGYVATEKDDHPFLMESD
jgi:hypothetical protein